MAHGTSIPNYDMVIKDKDGEAVVVNVSVFATPTSLRSEIDVAGFLVLRRLDYQRLIQRLVAERKNRELAADERRGRLTARELEVLQLAADGLNTKKIGERLSISAYTVKNHFTNILAKLKVHSRAEAVSLALRLELF
jgi:DNA-binding NarL/FixJ family response regulator